MDDRREFIDGFTAFAQALGNDSVEGCENLSHFEKLSRLFDLHLPRPAQMVTPKDPTHFERVLLARRRAAPALAGEA
jgi:hypothetical protein